MRSATLATLFACSSSGPAKGPGESAGGAEPGLPSSTGPLTEEQFKALHPSPTAAPAPGRGTAILSYDAEHGFANPSNPKYDQANAADAWKRVLAFLASLRAG